MIIQFMGLPGGGKTADAVKKILDNLKLGRTVYTNIDGMDNDKCLEHIKTYTGIDDYDLKTKLLFLDVSQVKEFWLHCKAGSLIVIDEVQKYFDNRSWASEGNKQMNSWASTHRHHGFDLVLVSQHIDRIDKAIRALVEWTYEYRKISFMGSLVKQKFIKYAYSGEDVTCKPLGKNILTYDKRIFACYQSYAGNDVAELGIMKHVNILKHPVFFAIPIVLVFALYMLFGRSSIASGDLFGARKSLMKGKSPVVSGEVQKPVFIERKEKPVGWAELKKGKAADFPQQRDKNMPLGVQELPLVALNKECAVVGSIQGIDGVLVVLKRCGGNIEKYINNVLVSTKPASVNIEKIPTTLSQRMGQEAAERPTALSAAVRPVDVVENE